MQACISGSYKMANLQTQSPNTMADALSKAGVKGKRQEAIGKVTAELLQVAKGPKHVHNIEAVALLADGFDFWRRDHHHRWSEILLYPFLHLHGALACTYSSMGKKKHGPSQA